MELSPMNFRLDGGDFGDHSKVSLGTIWHRSAVPDYTSLSRRMERIASGRCFCVEFKCSPPGGAKIMLQERRERISLIR